MNGNNKNTGNIYKYYYEKECNEYRYDDYIGVERGSGGAGHLLHDFEVHSSFSVSVRKLRRVS